MKSSIASIDIEKDGSLFTVHYDSGAVRYYVAGDLPVNAVRFLRSAPKEKCFIRRYPVISKDWKVGERECYTVLA